MITLQSKDEFNSVVSDINKNLIKPYQKANTEMITIENQVKSIRADIVELYEIIREVNKVIIECKSLYDRLVK